MADDDGITSRFTHLLQPIRDLALNWDVDIASSLEEYLEDLEGITVTLGEELRSAVNDGDEIESINFAEAALLIQGSALVYSKKVEYLYQLVHHTLDIVTNHKSKASTRQVSATALAEDEAAFKEASSNFLLLDDHIKEGKDIDIVDMEYDPSLHGYDTRGASTATNAKNINSSNNPMLALLLKEKRGSNFRLNSCEMHPSGALMIGSAQTGGQISDTLEKLISPSSVYFSPSNTSGSNSLVVHLNKDKTSLNDNDDDSIGGHEDYYGPDNGYENDDMQNDDMTDQHGHSNDNATSSLFGGNVFTATNASTQSTLNSNQTTKKQKDATAQHNPWLLLDPHDCSKQQTRPLRAGKTFKIPAVLSDARLNEETSMKEQDSNSLILKSKSLLQTLSFIGGGGGGGSNDLKKNSSLKAEAKFKFQGLAHPEFNYVLKMEKSRKMSAKRLEKLSQSSSSSAAQQYHAEEEDNFDDYGEDNHANYGGVDFGLYGDGGNDNYDDDDDDNDAGYLPNPNAMMSQFDEAEGVNANLRHDAFGAGSSQINQLELEDAFDQAPKTYADLCRDHIAKYMQGVDRYAHESQLSLRVGEWQERLGPMLKEQETRRPFDIHEYGREIIRKCIDVTQENKEQHASTMTKGGIKQSLSSHRDLPIDFSEMTTSQPRFEVCRLFLASLQLSNNLNIRLHHGEGVCGPEDLKLEVLNTHVGEDRFA